MRWNSLPSSTRRVVFALLLPVMTAHFAMSQTSTTGAIRGTVTDATGSRHLSSHGDDNLQGD